MKIIVLAPLFFVLSTQAQYTGDTLAYTGGSGALMKHLLKYLGNYDLPINVSTFYIAEVDFDENCKMSDISLFVTGDTNFNSLIIRAIASTEKNWSSTRMHSWRLSIPIYLFKDDENGLHAPAPTLGMGYTVFDSKKSAERNIKLTPVEITLLPPLRHTVNIDYSNNVFVSGH